jgi:hypothetical protein
MQALFCCNTACALMVGPLLVRGCKGLQPQVRKDHWSFDPGGRPVPRRRAGRCKLCLPRHGMRPNGGRYGLRGCKGLQPSRSGSTIGALILEGVRSLGAVLVDASFVCRDKACAQCGAFIGSAAARDCSPPGHSRTVAGNAQGVASDCFCLA